MGIEQDIATIRGDIATHAPGIFLYWFKTAPDYQVFFPNYKGKKLEKLKDVSAFQSHTEGVVSKVLVFVEKSENAAGLRIESKKLMAMPQHIGLEEQHFTDLFKGILGYLDEKLGGSYDKAAWEKASKNILKAIGAEL